MSDPAAHNRDMSRHTVVTAAADASAPSITANRCSSAFPWHVALAGLCLFGCGSLTCWLPACKGPANERLRLLGDAVVVGIAEGSAVQASAAAEEDDPLMQYLVLRRDLWTDLGWPLGSIVAQASVLGLCIRIVQLNVFRSVCQRWRQRCAMREVCQRSVRQACHASTAALWQSRDSEATQQYCAVDRLDHMRKARIDVLITAFCAEFLSTLFEVGKCKPQSAVAVATHFRLAQLPEPTFLFAVLRHGRLAPRAEAQNSCGDRRR